MTNAEKMMLMGSPYQLVCPKRSVVSATKRIKYSD